MNPYRPARPDQMSTQWSRPVRGGSLIEHPAAYSTTPTTDPGAPTWVCGLLAPDSATAKQ